MYFTTTDGMALVSNENDTKDILISKHSDHYRIHFPLYDRHSLFKGTKEECKNQLVSIAHTIGRLTVDAINATEPE